MENRRGKFVGKMLFLLSLIAVFTMACEEMDNDGFDAEEEPVWPEEMEHGGDVFLDVSGTNDVEDIQSDDFDVEQSGHPLYENGCSNPALLNVVLSFTGFVNPNGAFKSACIKHDYCYHSGKAAYNFNKGDCDNKFLSNMNDICNSKYWYVWFQCNQVALDYYAAVSAVGGAYYKDNKCTQGEFNSTECSTYEFFDGGRTPAFKDRIGVINSASEVLVKDGGLSAEWVNLASGASKLQLDAFRVGILVGSNLYVKEGDLTSIWKHLMGSVKDFQILNNRIAVLTTGGDLYIKDEGLSGAWKHMANGIADFQLEGNRVAVRTTGNELYVKEGALTALWVSEIGNVSDFYLEDKRIAVKIGATLYVKDGALNAEWKNLISNVKEFDLDNKRVGVVLTDGTAYVKDGSISANWVNEYSGVKSLQLEGNRIGVLTNSNVLLVKEGSLSANWVEETSSVSAFELAGKRIAVKIGSTLYVKDGSLSAGWVNEYGATSQFDLIGPAQWEESVGTLPVTHN